MKFIHSIKFRFTLWYLLVLAIVLLLLSTAVYFLLSQRLYNGLDDSLQQLALDTARNPAVFDDIQSGNIKQQQHDLLMLCYYSGDKLVKVVSGIGYSLDDAAIDRFIKEKRLFLTVPTTGNEEYRCFGTRLTPAVENSIPRIVPSVSDHIPVVLIIGRPTAPIKESLSGLLAVLFFAIPFSLAIAGGGGVFLARRALKPVDEITQAAREIEEKNLGRRINVKSKDELGRLAETLNQMISRLEDAFKRQRQFTSDASHELRTPLSVIQAEATLALQKDRDAAEYRKSLENISQDAGRMGKIVDQLLTLARADAAREILNLEKIDLGKLLKQLAADVDILCQEKGISLSLNVADGLAIRGDAEKLRRAFLNIVDNDLRYTPRGGSINIAARDDGKTTEIIIRDTGIGISAEELPHIFDRFYRVDKARSRNEGGSGLGLAICRNIIEAHGGQIQAESQPGKGTTFIIKLPSYAG